MWERLRGPAGAAAVAAVVALLAGLLIGGAVGGDDDSPATVQTGKAGPRGTVNEVYAAAGPAVASIRVRQGNTLDSGSGFLVSRDGTIVTNSHVVGDAERATVRFEDKGREYPVRVRGTDPSSDLAVLKVDPDALGDRKPLALAESNDVRVGDQVTAIGYPPA